MSLPYAEDVNYWKSGQSAPDTWMDRTFAEIKSAGGKVLADAFGRDREGRAAFMVEFQFGVERYRIVWPVLKSRTNNERAARIQAATLMYHDVKAKAVSAKILGFRSAFFQFLQLPDGRSMSEVATPDLNTVFPKLLTGGDQ